MGKYAVSLITCLGLFLVLANNFNVETTEVFRFTTSWIALLILGLFYCKFLFSLTVTMNVELFNSVDKLRQEIVKSKESKDSYFIKLFKAADLLNPINKLEKVIMMVALIFNPKTISFYKSVSQSTDKYFKYKDTQSTFLLKIAPAFVLITGSASLIIFMQGS